MFEWKVSLDTILTLGSFVIFVAIYIINMRATAKVFSVRLKGIDDTILEFKRDIKSLNDVVIQLTKQTVRIDNIVEMSLGTGKRLDELTGRFNRWVEGRSRPSADHG